MEGFIFLLFRFTPNSAILHFMRFVPIVSTILLCLALNAQTLQGKVVRVADDDTITRLDEGKVEYKIRLNRIDALDEGQAFCDVGMIYSTLTPTGPSGCPNVDTIL